MNQTTAVAKRPLLSLKARTEENSEKIDLVSEANQKLSVAGKECPSSKQGIICLIKLALKRATDTLADTSLNAKEVFELSESVVISTMDRDATDDEKRRYGGHKKTLSEYLQFYVHHHHCYDDDGNKINPDTLKELYGEEITTLKDVTPLTLHNGYFKAEPKADTKTPLRQIVKGASNCGIQFLQEWNGQEKPSYEETHMFLCGIYHDLLLWFEEGVDFSKLFTAKDIDRLIAIASESQNEYHTLAAKLMIALGKFNFSYILTIR